MAEGGAGIASALTTLGGVVGGTGAAAAGAIAAPAVLTAAAGTTGEAKICL